MTQKRSYAPAAAALAFVATAALAAGAAAGPLAGTMAPAVAPPGPVLVQATGSFTERKRKLRQHRAIIEDALAARRPQPAEPAEPAEPPQAELVEPVEPAEPPQAELGEPAEPPQPQTRSLQRPPEVDRSAEAPPISEAHGPVSCEAAAAIVADYGFSDIHPEDCSGELYTFSALRDGTEYALTVTAADGEIAEVSRQ